MSPGPITKPVTFFRAASGLMYSPSGACVATSKARAWIDAIRDQFHGLPLAPTAIVDRPHDALAFKA